MKFDKLLKKLKWQDIAFIVILIIYLFFQVNLMNDLQQIPSPIYGGDYYNSLGSVNHVKDGGNPLKSYALKDTLPHYMPIYSVIVGNLARVVDDSMAAMKIFAIVEMLLSLIVFYIFASYFFKDKSLGLASLLIYLPITFFPIWKYRQFTETLILPLFLFTVYYFYKKQSYKSAIFTGIMLGILSLSHYVCFVLGIILLAMLSIDLLIIKNLKINGKKVAINIKKFISKFKYLLLAGIIGFAISMIYWSKALFVYHLKTLNPMMQFAQPDFSVTNLKFVFIWEKIITRYLLNFSDVRMGILSILFLLGIFFLFFIKKYNTKNRFIIFLSISALIASFHYFITYPLFGTAITVHILGPLSFKVLTPFLAVFALSNISNILKEYKQYIIVGFLILFVLLNAYTFSVHAETYRWIQVGKTPLENQFYEMSDWVNENTDVNDVFLSTNELAFALNAMSGRKIVVTKRGHTNIFTDPNQRMLDAAIMLYGNDNEMREELFREYEVDYLYWNWYWIRSEFIFNENGELTSIFDPPLLHDNKETRDILDKYNISYIPTNTWLDPAIRDEQIKTFDVLIVLPSEFDLVHPWNKKLDEYLSEVWSYDEGGQTIARIYKITI